MAQVFLFPADLGAAISELTRLGAAHCSGVLIVRVTAGAVIFRQPP